MTSQTQHLITEVALNGLKDWFRHYVRSFPTTDPYVRQALELKENHTWRVNKEILAIGRELGLRDNELRLAEVMALFHDLGRFEQFIRYRTFADKKSENHGELGVKILQRERVLAVLNTDTRELILKAVSYHNRLNIPAEESPICVYFSKLLRDADKLDIFHVVCEYYYVSNAERSAAIELDLPDTPEASEEVMNDLEAGRMISMQNLRSLNDFKLLQMAWVYDVNFGPTFRMIYERGYLRKIRGALPPLERIDRIYERLLRYLQERSQAPATGLPRKKITFPDPRLTTS